MPILTTDAGREYKVTGKKLIWYPERIDDTTPTEVSLPLRIKLKLLLAIGEDDVTASNERMLDFIRALAADQIDAIQEMDVNDFGQMFTTWLETYNTLNGVSLGEASA